MRAVAPDSKQRLAVSIAARWIFGFFRARIPIVTNAVKSAISINIIDRNRQYNIPKKCRSGGLTCTERIATHDPVNAIVRPTAIAPQPSVKCTRRLRVPISNACTKNNTNHVAIAVPWTASRRKIVGSITRPLLPAPCNQNARKPMSIRTMKSAPVTL